MMKHFDYKPRGVCPMKISFDLGRVTRHNVSFLGGCNGNLQAISRVVEGMTVEQIEGYFKGISCSGKACAARPAGNAPSARCYEKTAPILQRKTGWRIPKPVFYSVSGRQATSSKIPSFAVVSSVPPWRTAISRMPRRPKPCARLSAFVVPNRPSCFSSRLPA